MCRMYETKQDKSTKDNANFKLVVHNPIMQYYGDVT